MSSTLPTGRLTTPAPQSPRRRVLGPPTTLLGRRALALLAIGVVCWALLVGAVAAGVSGDSAVLLETVFLFVPAFAAIVSVLAGLATAVLALVRGERSLLLALPLLAGGFALIFVIGELAVPH